MNTKPTTTSASIFSSVQRGCSSAVFLCEGEAGPRLSFGLNRTSRVAYRISLRSAATELWLSSDQPKPFALLLDKGGENGALRLAIYLAEAELPVIEHDGTSNDDGLIGQLIILAYSERNTKQAVLHAVFAGNGRESFLVDGSPDLCRHLDVASQL